MAATVIALRVASLLVFAAPMMLLTGRRRAEGPRAVQTIAERIPVVANFASVGVFFPLLVVFASDTEGQGALTLAIAGCLLAAAGAGVILWSRTALGAAWSLVPAADQAVGLVTNGPYRFVRHPIYLGFLMLTAGEAIAFNSAPAVFALVVCILPTFIWRAYAEERVLARVFGERHALYRKRTKLIVPFLL